VYFLFHKDVVSLQGILDRSYLFLPAVLYVNRDLKRSLWKVVSTFPSRSDIEDNFESAICSEIADSEARGPTSLGSRSTFCQGR
jgi:hypothetical protein